MQIASILAQSSLAFDVAYWVKAIMIIAGVIGVLYVILRQCGVQIPPFIVQIFWILLAVVVGCLAVGVLMRMM